MSRDVGSDVGTDPQDELVWLRARLLKGRGAGASPSEVDSHTRARVRYAGQPVADQLEALHERTAAARGDADAIRRNLNRTRNQLALDVGQIAARLDPARLYPARLTRPVRRLLLALAVPVLLRSHRGHRVLTTVLFGAAAIDFLRDARREPLSRERPER